MSAQLALVPEAPRDTATVLREFRAHAHVARAAVCADLAVEAGAWALRHEGATAAALRALGESYRDEARGHRDVAALLLAE